MSMRKIVKGSLISLAVLGMIGGSLNSNIANAKHRHVHYTRRIKHTRRHSKRNRLYRHHGRIHYSYRRNRHARRHYAKKYRHIRIQKPRYRKHVTVRKHHAKRSRANATHKYIVGTNIDGGQLLGSDPREAASANPGGSDDGILVKVGKKVVLDGHTFYQISSKNDIDANGWIYAGDLSNTPNGKAHPFNWVKNEPKIEKWEDEQNGNSDVDNNTSDTTTNYHNSSDTYGPDYDDTDNPTIDHNISKEEINLINQDRAKNNAAPLQESPALDQIAKMRAKQANDNTTGGDLHIDPNTGKGYYPEDAQKLGYGNLNNTDYGENLAFSGHNAKGFNKQLYTSEKPYNGGHYQNIIDSNYTQVGVGTYDDSMAEDFAGNNF